MYFLQILTEKQMSADGSHIETLQIAIAKLLTPPAVINMFSYTVGKHPSRQKNGSNKTCRSLYDLYYSSYIQG
jgi:hypothetical protein